ncbi:MAG: hypothetical protein WBW45_04690 [Bradyrhizobium sp.]|jgi:hypothetical protein
MKRANHIVAPPNKADIYRTSWDTLLRCGQHRVFREPGLMLDPRPSSGQDEVADARVQSSGDRQDDPDRSSAINLHPVTIP